MVVRSIPALAAVLLIFLQAPSQAAPFKPASQADRDTIAVFDQAWGGDETAFRKLRQLADSGNAIAQNAMGNFHAEGKFVEKDEAAALQWWTKAAEQGAAVAQYNVAQSYLRAMKHQDDLLRVKEWLSKAAEQGFMEAQIDLAVTYTAEGTSWFDPVQAFKWFTVGAANALAQGPNGEQDRLAIFAWNALTKIAKTMSEQQIAEGQKLSKDWLAEYGISAEREVRDLHAFKARMKAKKD
jgi:TPR repeat protein